MTHLKRELSNDPWRRGLKIHWQLSGFPVCFMTALLFGKW
jgi:hypothetical protein